MNDLYFLGNIFNQPPPLQEENTNPKCSRFGVNELESSFAIVRHNGIFRKIDINDLFGRLRLDLLPEGTIIDWVGDKPIPDGWFLLDGSSFNIDTYPDLFSVLGGDTLPNASGHITGMIGSSLSSSIGDKLGSPSKFLSVNNLESHTHMYVDSVRGSGGENDDGRGGPGTSPTTFNVIGNTSPAGLGEPMENVQPTVFYNKIIKAVPVLSTNIEAIPAGDLDIGGGFFVDYGFRPFCEHSDESLSSFDTMDTYIPTHNLSSCASAIQLGITVNGGAVSAFELEYNPSNYYEGFMYTDSSTGTDFDVFVRIEELQNSYWSITKNLDNINFDTVISSSDFPPCPSNSTWVDPVEFEGDTYNVNYLNDL